jgi:hypothetical protein
MERKQVVIESKNCKDCNYFDKKCLKPDLQCWVGEGKERKYFIYIVKEESNG